MNTFKAAEANRIVVKVNPYNTSQICSGCGMKVPKTLAIRVHACPYCGLAIGRDFNSARSICAAGQAVQAKTKEAALCVA